MSFFLRNNFFSFVIFIFYLLLISFGTIAQDLSANIKKYCEKALEFYKNSLKIFKEIGDKKGIGSCYNNIGNIYQDQGNSVKALEHHEKVMEKMAGLSEKVSTLEGQIVQFGFDISKLEGKIEDIEPAKWLTEPPQVHSGRGQDAGGHGRYEGRAAMDVGRGARGVRGR